MAIEPSTSSAPQAEAQTSVQQLKAEQAAAAGIQENGASVNGQDEQLVTGEMDGLESQMSSATIGELHAACAEGRLEDVRAVLSRGLEGLESLDVNTGCTPIVLAIRENHHDVVRELLSAGAIVPPPGLTNDPLMLSILCLQPMYGIPPQFMGMPPQDFYQQPGFYPAEAQQQHQRGMFMPLPPSGPAGPRKDGVTSSPNGGNPNNLPPAEVSKTIPCRNFPNCKYGNSCVFFHPRHQPFFPSAHGPAPIGPNGSFIPQGYENGYPAPYPPVPGPYFIPNPNNQAFVPNQVDQQQQLPASDIPQESQQPSDIQHDQQQQQQQHVPSAIAPVFVPGFQPSGDMMSPPPPPAGQFGMSPLSPSMLGSSLPSIPPAEAFFAAASPPPTGFMPPLPPVAMNGPVAAHARRQSFNQQQFGMPGKPFGHGKKPSFSGGAPKWMGRPPAPNGAAKLGSWKDGNPPPCAFYNQGNCRNGEFCKFPHLDAEGNDCRHPDVIRGVLPPVPSFSGRPRGMRMMGGPGFNGPVDPSFRQQQHQQQIQFLQHQRMAAAQAQQGINASASAPSAAQSTDDKAESAPIEKSDSADVPSVTVDGESTSPASAEESAKALPAKPVMPNIIRSASQPGVQRVHVNGNTSRSHSPAPSNVSFHGNGHPRRAGSRVPPQMNMNGHTNFVNGGARNDKKGPSTPLQRVPQAHEFPALGLGSSTPTSEKKEASWGGKTAAQVLSAPAPPKPETPVEVKVTEPEGEGSDSEKSGKAGSITMDSDSESDAVIISTKPSTAAQSGTATPAVTAPELKKAPISFASAVGAAGLPTGLESAPVALKA
ncbi:hypothetical protein I302_106760 [Kwoniella bestiolae CBS 10118]|uniref:C3H1-type domain-containing protein n=1 Tax=Kwoniella bestiolae CBS 10118 TaxID=1296100 RepID=A0A1B9G0G4_9TREE|nr:hypothetical protein I302_05974 [Kwoniella bestiolae CBS 10118]OCF24514.1 hypothetical protein I302_05974 [Kwoniella bestiolae CBS 10118]